MVSQEPGLLAPAGAQHCPGLSVGGQASTVPSAPHGLSTGVGPVHRDDPAKKSTAE